MTQRIFIAIAGLLALLATVSGTEADSKLSAARGTLEKWVETRQLISRTRADWQQDKEIIEQSIRLFERELAQVEEQIGKVSTNHVQINKERAEAEALLKESEDGLAPARDLATELEREVRRIAAQLPIPLQEILKPSLNKLPAEASQTKMKAPERLQALVGVLNELDKFNSAVTLFSEKRSNVHGVEMSVETVYLGLGAAYFVNDSGNFAGIGKPGAQGWEWTERPEIASQVREVIRIYRNERPAKFITLPLAIQ